MKIKYTKTEQEYIELLKQIIKENAKLFYESGKESYYYECAAFYSALRYFKLLFGGEEI